MYDAWLVESESIVWAERGGHRTYSAFTGNKILRKRKLSSLLELFCHFIKGKKWVKI